MFRFVNSYFKMTLIALGVSFMIPAPSAQAEVGILAGGGLTTADIPLFGVTAQAYYQSPFFLGGMEDQIVLQIHNYSGTSSKTVSGITGTVSVTFSAYELNWYFLKKGLLGFDALGPGIGYGWAETVETQDAGVDLSPFMTANDIHYGSLMLKGQEEVFSFKCEGIASSFGGLIGVEFLCGIGF
jgi:hypothetical protein